MFVEQTKVISSQPGTVSTVRLPVFAKPSWFAWLRPAFAVPVLAALMAVILYQNLVTYPQLKQAVNRPHLLPWASINIGTRGADAPVIAAKTGQGFLLFVNIPPESRYSSYTADLYNPMGKLEWSLTIPADTVNDTWPVQVPAANRGKGVYTLAVHGVTAAGDSVELARRPFELQIVK
jgi:hypothetical protein